MASDETKNESAVPDGGEAEMDTEHHPEKDVEPPVLESPVDPVDLTPEEAEFNKQRHLLQCRAGRANKALDTGKRLTAAAEAAANARREELEAAGQALHDAVDKAVARLTEDLKQREEAVLTGYRDGLIEAAKLKAACHGLSEEVEAAQGLRHQQQNMCEKIQALLQQQAPDTLQPTDEVAQKRLQKVRLHPLEEAVTRIEDIKWAKYTPEESWRKCKVCLREYDENQENGDTDCVSHPGAFMSTTAIMPGWSCCFAQWKGDTGCVRSAHQPCEIYDAQKAAAALGDPVDDSFFGHLCSSAATLFGPEEVIDVDSEEEYK